MSMLRAEGFYHFDTAADWQAKGHNSSGVNIAWHPTGGRGGRGAVEVGLNADIHETLPSAWQTTFAHVAIFTTFRSGAQLAAFRSATDTNVFIEVQDDGSLVAYRQSPPFSQGSFLHAGSTIIAQSTNLGIIRNSTWHHLQIKCKVHASAGELTVYVDGIQQLTFTGNTYCGAGNLSTSLFGMGTNFGVSSIFYSDLVIFNDQGSINNTYGGDMAVYESVSPVDGDELQWTRSTGAGTYSSHVDDNPQNGDTDYLETSVVGDRVCFSFPTISSALGTIVAIKETVCHRKTEPTTALLKLYSRSDDDVDHDESTAHACTEDYIFDERIYELDLKDNSSWTAAKVNATQLGVLNTNG